jgi:hypothetical protein
MHPIQDLFLESFSYEIQFDMHFYMHSYLHKIFILVKSGCYRSVEDCHDFRSPGNRCRTLPSWVPSQFTTSRGSPGHHEFFFHHGAVFELVLDRVLVMWTCRFKKFHQVVFGRPSLPLEVTFGSCYEPLAGAVGFHTAVAIAGQYGNASGSALLPLRATLSAFPGAFVSGIGGRSPATASDCSRVS